MRAFGESLFRKKLRKNVGKFFWLLFFPRKVTRISSYSTN